MKRPLFVLLNDGSAMKGELEQVSTLRGNGIGGVCIGNMDFSYSAYLLVLDLYTRT